MPSFSLRHLYLVVDAYEKWVKKTLVTVVGVLPMAFKIETGSEAYAPLARAIIGGLISSIILTIFVVPAAYLLIDQRRARLGLTGAPWGSD